MKNIFNPKNIAKMAFLMILVSCGDDECPIKSGTEISFDPILTDDQEFTNGCVLETTGSNHVINSQKDYADNVSCIDLPVIDFEKHTLLAGSIEIPTSGIILHQSIIKDCHDRIIFSFKISEGHGQAFKKLTFFAIIDKISENTEVIFDIDLKN